MFNRIVTIAIFLITTCVQAQDNRYMVFFKDKTGTPYTISAPEQFLSARAIERRNRQGIAVNERDMPVVPGYVQAIKDLGVEVMYPTRWMNGVLVQCPSTSLPVIESLSFVQGTEFVAPGEKPFSSGRRKFNARKASASGDQPTDNQLTMIGIPDMHDAGYHGEGMIIAVFDAGFEGVNTAEAFQPVFSEDRLNTTVSYDFVYDQPDVFRHDDHGTGVLSVIAGYVPDAFTGGAYKANYQLYVTEDVKSEYRIEEYNWLFAAERADSAGADIINSSLGYNTFDLSSMDYSKSDLDGQTAVVSKAAQLVSQRGMIVVCSAGNEGNNSWQLITPPADNKYVLAAAAVNSLGERSVTSSVGPSADGRIKPDVAALGVGVTIIKPSGSIGTSSGTSFSSPLIASLVAGVWQRYPDLKATEITNAIRSSASQANNPDVFLGYGMPNFKAVVNMLEWKPQEELLVVYPNPVVDTLTIRPRSPIEVSTCRVEVISLQGQTIADRQIEFDWLDRDFQTDFSDLASGMYFLRIWIDKQIFSYKLIKI
ncbi:MAG TPA: S8 family peptidase [Cyclobacteriaceae bacterium]|nr:S8 family peptidase [Cyclobacteriaceae bacterium]